MASIERLSLASRRIPARKAAPYRGRLVEGAFSTRLGNQCLILLYDCLSFQVER